MIGTKLLLLSFVVYVSGQGLTYYGTSNVRLPPRPLYRPGGTPTVAPITPVSNPQPPVNQPPPPQPAHEPERPAIPQPPSDPRPPQLQPNPMPDSEIPNQPIYSPIPPKPAIPVQPAPRPINVYPRPLKPWTWKPVTVEVVTEKMPSTLVYPETSSAAPIYVSIADSKPEIEATPMPTPLPTPKPTPMPAPVEEPVVVIQPVDVAVLPPSSTEAPATVIEIIPEPSVAVPEITPLPLVPEPRPIEEKPLINPILIPEDPALHVEQPQPPPVLIEAHPNQRLPSVPRPLPTPEPVISPKPEPITPILVIPPKQIKPISTVPLPPRQPSQPLRPNYRPKPYEPVVPRQPLPDTPRPIPDIQRPPPLPTSKPLIPLLPTTSYPTPASSQPLPQPTISYPVVNPTSVVPPPPGPEIISIIPISDFKCSKGNGYYTVVNECDTYIECQSQRAYKHTCPDGLHFNNLASYPEYPCAYPSEVKCESSASKQNARPTNQCPNRYGFFPISGDDCSKYIMCQEGIATIMNCPFGLVFNDHLSSCDWPENVPQCNSNAFKDFSCPMPPEDDPDLLTRFSYGTDCSLYVACQRGHPRLLKCDAGMSFDENSQVCIDTDLVAACRNSIS